MLLASATATTAAPAQSITGPDTLVVRNGAVEVRALLWRPRGNGPFPGILFNHGSGTTLERQAPQAAMLGQIFSRRGYVFMYLYRRGTGLSASQGTSVTEQLMRARADDGIEAHNALQIRLLESEHLSDATAALRVLRALPEVDAGRVALVGHSFGGSLSMIMAEHDTTIRAVVSFGGATGSWDQSPPLQERLLDAVRRARAPFFFAQAENDYSLSAPTALARELARLRRPYRLETYPPVGTTAAEGHDHFVLRVAEWERDVFPFLAASMKR
jgi:dienelactone hydrolase